MHPLLSIHPEVRQALSDNRPVVALESTIISHGMPWPQNMETALAVETVVRQEGAVPATIAVMNGKCIVGMQPQELEYFAREQGIWKTSLRDLPFVIAQQKAGATTVAATMRIAALAGIRVFVTGGIGGVHRGAETTMDISADLTEMGETSVAVVSAGIKSILDIGRTLEYMETLGIPVVTIGQDAFPGFYSRDSGHRSPLRIDTPEAIAALLRTKWSLGLSGSVLIANPLPKGQDIPAEIMEAHIQAALRAAEAEQIRGKEVTPFLLRYIAENTDGESLDTNIALIKHNAKTGAAIAIAYTKASDTAL